MKRSLYRVRQFWHALTARPTHSDLREVRAFLPPALFLLFSRLQPAEQAHAIAVFRKTSQADPHPDLATAALLHDVGKIMYPLSVWQRALIVLENRQPNGRGEAAENGGQAVHRLVADRHPDWGAELAGKAGATPLAAALIRRHQDPAPSNARSLEDRLLAVLQAADNQS